MNPCTLFNKLLLILERGCELEIPAYLLTKVPNLGKVILRWNKRGEIVS